MDDLNARLNQLEQQVRTLRRTLGLLAVSLVVALFSCATLGNAQGSEEFRRAGTLKLRKLSIIDRTGKERIVLGTLPDGSAGIAQYALNGKLRMNAMTNADDSAGILHYDRSGNRRIGTLTLTNGDAGLLLSDPAGVPRLTVTTKTDGAAGLDHYDRRKVLRITDGTSPDNQSNLFHYDTMGVKRVMALTAESGAVAIGITDRAGVPTWIQGSE
jgi:hypothetical protein